MTDFIRLEISGKHAETWNRIFATLGSLVERAVDVLAADSDEGTRETAKQFTRDIGELAKDFIKAKFERAGLENEMKIAEIAVKFEELKLIKAKREREEVETQLRMVDLDKARLELWERRLVKALGWLGFLQTHVVRDDQGNVVLLLSNQDLSAFQSHIMDAQRISTMPDASGE